MAGGSQIIINKDGITIITPAKFEAKAGQHLFKKGSKVNFSLPEIPNVLLPYSNKLDVYNLFKTDELNDINNLKYSVVRENGQFQKGNLDEYGRTKRIKSNQSEKVKILVGGDEWHYYIDNFGGTMDDETLIKFVDLMGQPIANLEFKLSDDNNKTILINRTNKEAESKFLCNTVEFPLLSVKYLTKDEFKPITRIENNLVREILLISPKILKEVELLQESEEPGDYLRSNYSENSD